MSPCRRDPDLTVLDPTVITEALFVSPLQPSQHPDAATVTQAVEAVLNGHDARWCTEQLAQESGDHPGIAAARMCWCRQVVADVYPPAGATS